MAAELSLKAELLCSSGRLRMELSGTPPVLGRCRFLFFTRMRPIRSWGLGRGTPGASWWARTGQGLLGTLPPSNALPGSEPPYRVLVQWVNEQCVPKDGAAVLGHLGLLLCSVGPRSEVRGFWGEAEVPRARQRLAGSVQGPRVRGHGSSPIVPWWLSLGPQRSPGLGLGSRGQGPTHESTWFSKERMTG